MQEPKEPLQDTPILDIQPKSNRFLWGAITLVLVVVLLSMQWVASYATTHWLHAHTPKPLADEPQEQHAPILKAPIVAPEDDKGSINPIDTPQKPLDVKAYITEHRPAPDDTLAKMQLLQKIKEQQELQKHREEMLESDGFVAIGVSMSSAQNAGNNSTNSGVAQNSNTQYLNSMSGKQVQEMTAEQLGDLRYRILKGTALQGVTESAIDSDLPNIIRAHITEDVFGENSNTPLIHNGDKLVGEYRSGDIRNGQVRLYVVWTRLVLQSGYSINLDSSGSDPLGRAGMAGPVDRHFLERYGSALLMSSISASASLVGVNGNDRYNSQAAFRQGVSESFSQTATNELQQNMGIQNTIRPPQGTPISILVNHDLSFENMLKAQEVQL